MCRAGSSPNFNLNKHSVSSLPSPKQSNKHKYKII